VASSRQPVPQPTASHAGACQGGVGLCKARWYMPSAGAWGKAMGVEHGAGPRPWGWGEVPQTLAPVVYGTTGLFMDLVFLNIL
jgi:hypothetical protein